MNTGIQYFLIGIILDGISLIMMYKKVSEFITAPLGLISIILIIIGVTKLNKYDKVREIGRKAIEEKKKRK